MEEGGDAKYICYSGCSGSSPLPPLYPVLTVYRNKNEWSKDRIGRGYSQGKDGHEHGARSFAMRQNLSGFFRIKGK